jgi:glutamate/aspartate transport system substrate-binding protein
MLRRTALVGWLALAALAGTSGAQTPEGALAGTLQKARSTGEVAIGYREASIPLSYLSVRNEPIGYSIDLCRAIVDAMSTEVSRPVIAGAVTSETRHNAVTGGVDRVDDRTSSAKRNIDFSR